MLSNHYHFVARSPEDPATLKRVVSKLHMLTAKEVNRLDGTPGRSARLFFGVEDVFFGMMETPGGVTWPWGGVSAA